MHFSNIYSKPFITDRYKYSNKVYSFSINNNNNNDIRLSGMINFNERKRKLSIIDMISWRGHSYGEVEVEVNIGAWVVVIISDTFPFSSFGSLVATPVFCRDLPLLSRFSEISRIWLEMKELSHFDLLWRIWHIHWKSWASNICVDLENRIWRRLTYSAYSWSCKRRKSGWQEDGEFHPGCSRKIRLVIELSIFRPISYSRKSQFLYPSE